MLAAIPGFETLLIGALILAAALGAALLYAALSGSSVGAAARAVAAGDFATALDATGDESRHELRSAATAAKHLGRFADASQRLERLLGDDPEDGEAWLELGLVRAYEERTEEALECFGRAAAVRSDLLEAITLHRAWTVLRAGDEGRARSLFEEIEAPLENKLRTDLGGGEPLFAEWFWQSAELWSARGDHEAARWAWREGCRAAPGSRLPTLIGSDARYCASRGKA